MLRDKDAMATVAVKNVEVAARFYEGTLGLTRTRSEQPSVAGFKSGSSALLVYESQYAGTNKATAVTWVVGDELEAIVRNLQAKGVVFEHYEFPGGTRKGDVHVMGETKAAWFKDPDGNILAIVNG